MTATIDRWQQLLASWDAQQTGYLPRREERFAVMARTIGEVIGDSFVALDLGCGPGSLSQRILTAYPGATAVAVDSDPLLLELGRQTLARYAERLHLIDADLRDPHWHHRLGVENVDVVVSTTALHWLDPGTLYAVYRRAADLLRPGGLLLNGDNLPYDTTQSTHQRLAAAADDRVTHRAFAVDGVPDWARWWAAATADPLLTAVAEERAARRQQADRTYGPRDAEQVTPLSTHVAALSAAGFREIGTIWQHHDDRVLLAVR
ncbi:class I SAM-dependent methyltransferase [Solwaraspora sp. WMMB335]|uniref:class I SAM-dependent methyltransferase n=1 Tax=Solwaraspora sp. WMMB335 TaxID=3404118 RepID=UPI003B95B9F4